MLAKACKGAVVVRKDWVRDTSGMSRTVFE